METAALHDRVYMLIRLYRVRGHLIAKVDPLGLPQPIPPELQPEFFGFTEDANHRPNDTRIAFWAETHEQVDRLAQVVRDAGGRNLEGPQIWSEYSAGYYAFFFEDPDGNKLEICCRRSAIVAE